MTSYLKTKWALNFVVPPTVSIQTPTNGLTVGAQATVPQENLFAKTYDATKLEEDTERVRAEFQNRGYFKVLVEDPKTEIHDTGHTGLHVRGSSQLGKSVDITMPIEEGDRYRLGTISSRTTKPSPTPTPCAAFSP